MIIKNKRIKRRIGGRNGTPFPLTDNLKIIGKVQKLGANLISPVQVFLLDAVNLVVIQATTTDNTGNYYFSYLEPRQYAVAVVDNTKQFNAVIQSGVTPR